MNSLDVADHITSEPDSLYGKNTDEQKPMCHLNLCNLMDVQELPINSRKCQHSELVEFPKSLASLNINHSLPLLTGEAGSKLLHLL
ncbi:hypothetical protein J6590_057837 [Homalodisca vitripennis]|nr:hypothetical protein J6590_057837 [Homalodisca vitripennis]